MFGRVEIGDILQLDDVGTSPLPGLLEKAEDLDPLGGDAVLVAEDRQ